MKTININYYTIIVIFILSFLLFKSCNKEPEIVYKDRIKVLKVLEKQKQEIKTKIVYVQKQTVKAIEKVRPMTTAEIDEYYVKRYGDSIHKDTIAKKNIVELIQKDGCFEELKLTNEAINVSDSIISNLNDAVILQAKTIRKEKRKKTFWQVLTVGVIIAAFATR